MEFLSDKDTATHRVCGTCNELKAVEEFYKDGKTPQGDIKYRRDCKECYRTTRLQDAARKLTRGSRK